MGRKLAHFMVFVKIRLGDGRSQMGILKTPQSICHRSRSMMIKKTGRR